ncbi:MAG TPA: hypothetical protein VJL31_04435 [Gemmatimonadales bacterium]|jgi:hypothetical protein|nr:hypothetical protein [Gemmatimonadales bacterium]
MGWIFFAIALVIIAKSPLGMALAHRIRFGVAVEGGSGAQFEELAGQVNEELTALRAEMTDLAERMDFAERSLLQLRRPDALPQGHRPGPEADSI